MELKGSKTEKNLMEAFAGESMARSKYTFFASVAKKAREEGFNQLAALFTMVGQIEKEHEERYRELAANLKDGKVFAREEQQVWICRNCGYTYIGKSAPMKCPVCAHPQSFFELKKHNY